MNSFRLSGSARPLTCSADTVVPRMTNRSTPASTTLFHSCAVARGERGGDGDTLGAYLLDPLGDEVGADRLGVDLLHSPVGQGVVERRDLRKQRLGILVAGPEPLQVEHADAAELPHGDCCRR